MKKKEYIFFALSFCSVFGNAILLYALKHKSDKLNQVRLQYSAAVAQMESSKAETIRKTLEKEIDEKMEYLAFHDELSGLYNRRAYESIVCSDSERPVAVVFLDIDGFKIINDTYGHDAGDDAISLVSGKLKEVFRYSDLIFRYGGDEFCVIMNRAETLTERSIREKIYLLNYYLKREWHKEISLSVSAGVSFGLFRDVKDDLLPHADSMLLKAKRKNDVVCVSSY